MATTTPAFIPVELYLRSDYEPDAEYVDGVIEERPMGEWDHSSWQGAILAWFRLHAREWNIHVRPELRVQVSPTRFRVPDVTVVDRAWPKEQIITRAPLAVFEILSPEDTVRRTLRKLADYEALGVAQIWVIDPEIKSYLRFADGALERTARFGNQGEVICFEMTEIEAFLD